MGERRSLERDGQALRILIYPELLDVFATRCRNWTRRRRAKGEMRRGEQQGYSHQMNRVLLRLAEMSEADFEALLDAYTPAFEALAARPRGFVGPLSGAAPDPGTPGQPVEPEGGLEEVQGQRPRPGPLLVSFDVEWKPGCPGMVVEDANEVRHPRRARRLQRNGHDSTPPPPAEPDPVAH